MVGSPLCRSAQGASIFKQIGGEKTIQTLTFSKLLRYHKAIFREKVPHYYPEVPKLYRWRTKQMYKELLEICIDTG